jgi:hypothetical protein
MSFLGFGFGKGNRDKYLNIVFSFHFGGAGTPSESAVRTSSAPPLDLFGCFV